MTKLVPLRQLSAVISVVSGLVAGIETSSAEVLLDSDPIETEHAFLLPDHADESAYYYIPKTPRIAEWPTGKPKFTLIKYFKTGKEISGGLLHVLSTYGLTEEQREDVEDELQDDLPEAKLVGPVQFTEGTFRLISASVGPDGSFSENIVGTGKAPLLAGQEAAVSIALTEEGATLLEESFQEPTSDVSLQYVLTYEGLTPAYEATLTVDWERVHTHKEIKGKTGSVFFRANISKVFDELREEGAIELDVIGSDANMDALLETVYNMLINRMFDAQTDQGGGEESGEFLAKAFGSTVKYKLKKTRHEGTYQVDLRKRVRDERQIPITGNLGNIHRRFSNDEELFRTVDLDDPDFEQRTVHVIVDREDYSSFKEYINFAGVSFRKEHENGNMTRFNSTLDHKDFADGGNRFSFNYLRKGDPPDSWLTYEYRPIWSFRGGVEVVGGFSETDRSVLTLTPPYRYRNVEVTANSDNLNANDIVAVAIRFRHEFKVDSETFVRTKELLLRPGDALNKKHKYLSERDDASYDYKITYFRGGGEPPVTTEWRTGEHRFLYVFYDPESA